MKKCKLIIKNANLIKNNIIGFKITIIKSE